MGNGKLQNDTEQSERFGLIKFVIGLLFRRVARLHTEVALAAAAGTKKIRKSGPSFFNKNASAASILFVRRYCWKTTNK